MHSTYQYSHPPAQRDPLGIEFTIDPVAHLVGYTVEGATTDAQAQEFIGTVLADPHFGHGFDFLGECQGTHEPNGAYPPALARAVRAQAANLGPCRWAVVVSSPYGAGVVQRWAELVPASGVEVATFQTREAAVDWLAATNS
jgi:hypothetical protein